MRSPTRERRPAPLTHSRDRVDDAHPLRAEVVAPVRHPGRGRGIRDQHDPVRPQEVEDHAHGVVGEVDAVGDELDPGVPDRGRAERTRHRAG